MADVKISALPNAAALDGTEQVPIVQAAVTKKTTTLDIAALFTPIAGPPGPAGPAGPPGPTNNHVLSGGATASASWLLADGGGVFSELGTDSSGQVIANAGTGAGVPGAIIQINFAVPFALAPQVVIQPLNAASAALGAWVEGTSLSAASFQISVATLPPGTNVVFSWHAIGSPI